MVKYIFFIFFLVNGDNPECVGWYKIRITRIQFYYQMIMRGRNPQQKQLYIRQKRSVSWNSFASSSLDIDDLNDAKLDRESFDSTEDFFSSIASSADLSSTYLKFLPRRRDCLKWILVIKILVFSRVKSL